MMVFNIVAHFVIGVVLGLKFRVHILAPMFAVIALEGIVILVFDGLFSAVSWCIAAVMSAQLGYLAGLALVALASRTEK